MLLRNLVLLVQDSSRTIPNNSADFRHKYHAHLCCGNAVGTEPKLALKIFRDRNKSTLPDGPLKDRCSNGRSPAQQSREHC